MTDSIPFIDKKLNVRNFYDPHRLETFTDNYAVKAIPALFITTPMLNFDFYNINKSEFFKYLVDTDPNLLSLLSFGFKPTNFESANFSPFIKLLSNRFESFSIKSTVSQPRENGETFYGYKQYLPGPYVNSVSGDTISIEYTETENLDILNLHKAWMDYIEGLGKGIFKPSKQARDYRFLDFTSSMYLFSLAPDGETILFYEKLTGCSPISLPYDAFSSKAVNDREIVRFSIDYTWSYKDDLNPRILTTFNALSRKNKIASMLEMKDLDQQGILGVSEQKVDLTNTHDMYLDEDIAKAYMPVVIAGKDANGKQVFKLKYIAPSS